MTTEPPALITWSGIDYMMRVTEINEFASFFFGIIEHREAIASGMVFDSAERFKNEADEYAVDSPGAKRQMVQQILLSRIIESFNHYMTGILGDIFLARPEMLSAEGEIKVAKVLELRAFDEIVRFLVEKKINDVSYSSLSDMRAFIKERTKIDPYPTDREFELVQLATEVRNLIAHNDCRVNEVFLRKTKLKAEILPLSETGKFIITDDWLNQVIDCISAIVFAFDDAASVKFALDRRDRFHVFAVRT